MRFVHGIFDSTFLSTSSARRTTCWRFQKADRRKRNFYPRPPRGGRPYKFADFYNKGIISIHVLREEDDLLPGSQYERLLHISIHVLREEDDNNDFNPYLPDR